MMAKTLNMREIKKTKKSKSPWNANFEKLKIFSKKNGHCNVPFTGETRALAKWATRQKKAAHAPRQQQKLVSIGFDWRTQREKENEAWEKMLRNLTAYKEHFGNCNVPYNYGENPELGTWVANQRRRGNQDKLCNERRKKLNDVGFEWRKNNNLRKKKSSFTAYDDLWEAMFEELTKYKEEYGDCDVPYNFLPSPTLGSWVCTQRRVFNGKTFLYGSEKKMSTERITKLESIGFSFDITKDKKSPDEENSESSES